MCCPWLVFLLYRLLCWLFVEVDLAGVRILDRGGLGVLYGVWQKQRKTKQDNLRNQAAADPNALWQATRVGDPSRQ